MKLDNTPDNDPSREPPIFSAVLTPHRSLSPAGFLIFMAVLGGISFVTGMVFLIAGAWPVFGFFGLDVLLVYWAFRLNYRSAQAYEQVTVTPSELTVRKVSHRGRVREWTLNPVWVRLHRDVHEEFGLQRLFLELQGRQARPSPASCRRRRRKVLRSPSPAHWRRRSAGRPGARRSLE